MQNSASFRARVAAYGNPYRFIELEAEEDVNLPAEPTTGQKRSYLRQLENPYAWHALFDREDTEAAGIAPPRMENSKTLVGDTGETVINKERLECLLNDVLDQYEPYVARNEWARVVQFRSEFLEKASITRDTAKRAAYRLAQLKFSLMPGENVEYNRAPAARMIAELRKLLS